MAYRTPGVLLIMALYWEAVPERGTFLGLQVYERVGISLVEVYEREAKICHFSLEGLKVLTDVFCGYEKVKKTSWFCDLLIDILKTMHFQPVKRAATIGTYVEGVPFVNRWYMKGVPFLSRVKRWTTG